MSDSKTSIPAPPPSPDETSAHTPGPWVLKASNDGYPGSAIYAASGYGIGKAWNLNGRPENEANARLIAAAPALLDALRGLSFAAQITGGVAGRDEGLCAAIAVAESALSKASPTPQATDLLHNPAEGE